MFYGSVWDPKLIISQMLTMQCLFYLFLGMFLWFLDIITENYLTLDQIFLVNAMSFTSVIGLITIASHLLNAIAGSLLLVYVVERAKKCLDFAATVHILHLVFSSIYSRHFPTTWVWWVINIICLVLMAVIGEYLCMRRELKEIPLSAIRSRAASNLLVV